MPDRNRMNTCKTCKHWNNADYRVEDKSRGLCKRISCSDDYLEKEKIARPAEAICSGEGICGELITCADFGCTEYT